MSRLLTRSLVVAALALAFLPGRAYASLTTFATYTGNVGYSSDGFGSLAQTGTISASVPLGATVLAAYLYSSTNTSSGSHNAGGTLAGSAIAYGAPVINAAAPFLASQRADVTSIIKPLIDGGPGGIYNFTVTETNGGQDGEALVVVYQLASLPTATVAILDGFSAVGGDSATLTFGSPLAAGFFAEMIIGDGFSCCDENTNPRQSSTISVNGTTITQNAGGLDDGANVQNGSLITVGGFNDPFSAHLPSYTNDHERYNLATYLAIGDTSATIRTNNPSADDNIFMATFYLSGDVKVTTGVPDQADTMVMLGLGLALLGVAAFRRAA
jgi:hypothetical protein